MAPLANSRDAVSSNPLATSAHRRRRVWTLSLVAISAVDNFGLRFRGQRNHEFFPNSLQRKLLMDCMARAHTHRMPHGLSTPFGAENRPAEKVSRVCQFALVSRGSPWPPLANQALHTQATR